MTGGAGGSGYIGGCSLSSAAFTAPGASGLPSSTLAQASPYYTSDADYITGVGLGGQGQTSTITSMSNLGNGGNGLVMIYTASLPPTNTMSFYYSNGILSYVVPPSVSTLFVKLWGGGGGMHTRTSA